MAATPPVPAPTVPDDHPLAALERHLRWSYRKTLAHVRPASSKGYWRAVEPCGACPMRHYTSGCGVHHTYTYSDPTKGADGRFTSPYRTWRLAHELAATTPNPVP